MGRRKKTRYVLASFNRVKYNLSLTNLSLVTTKEKKSQIETKQSRRKRYGVLVKKEKDIADKATIVPEKRREKIFLGKRTFSLTFFISETINNSCKKSVTL
jgi:tRNA U54 and U55 pseudouridine synthase Pus10